MSPLSHDRTRGPRGFTLVEVLMVLAIIGISTLVAMPSLVKSIRGNRLRVGTRTIVMAGNYARTMAILRNQEMKLVLNKDANSVTVEPFHEAVPATTTSTLPGLDAQGDTNAAAETTSSPPPLKIVRQLDAVHIDSVSVDHRRGKTEDRDSVIVYQSNGRCNPYEVRVVDEYDSAMIITVDAVASPKVRKDDE